MTDARDNIDGSRDTAVEIFVNGLPISSTNPMPIVGSTGSAQAVNGSVAVTNFPTTQPISGSVSVSNLPATQPVSASTLPLPSGASTSALQPALNADGGGLAHVTNFPATQPISGSIAVTNLPATQPVSGNVAVTNFPATQPVSGVFSDPYSRPFFGEVAMTPGAAYSVGRSLKVICTAAGNVSVTYSDGSTGLWVVAVGTQTLPLEITQVNTSGTTASATYFNLK